jgi:hypothetical protein
MKGMKDHMRCTVEMNGRSGRGKHNVNIECRKAEKDDATYSRRKVNAFKLTRWRREKRKITV